MSIYQFPNATQDKVDALFQLAEQLLPATPASIDPKASAALELIMLAYLCAAVEETLNSADIQSCHPYDPQIVAQIKAVLYSCR